MSQPYCMRHVIDIITSRYILMSDLIFFWHSTRTRSWKSIRVSLSSLIIFRSYLKRVYGLFVLFFGSCNSKSHAKRNDVIIINTQDQILIFVWYEDDSLPVVGHLSIIFCKKYIDQNVHISLFISFRNYIHN